MVDDGHDRPAVRSEDEAMDAGSMTTPGQVPAPGDPGALAQGPTVHPPGTQRAVMVLGAALLLVIAVVIAFVATTTQPAAEFGPGTPEHTFQAYLTAWEANDLDGAYAQFSERVRSQLSIDEYRAMARDWAYGDETERRVVLVGSTVRVDRATLELRIDERSGGGLLGGDSVWSRRVMVELVRDGGAWHLDQAMAGLEPIWYEK
jgi:hypothetical protein